MWPHYDFWESCHLARRPSVADTKKTIAHDALGIQCHQLSARFYFLVVYKKNGRDIYRESEC